MWVRMLFYNIFSFMSIKSFQYKRFIQTACLISKWKITLKLDINHEGNKEFCKNMNQNICEILLAKVLKELISFFNYVQIFLSIVLIIKRNRDKTILKLFVYCVWGNSLTSPELTDWFNQKYKNSRLPWNQESQKKKTTFI